MEDNASSPTRRYLISSSRLCTVGKRFKFEEPRIEQIQDLEVCICTDLEVEMASAASASITGCLVRSRLPLGECQHHRNNGIALLPQLPKPLISLSSSSKAAAIAIAIPTATASERKERSSFARTAAVRHLVGSITTTHGLRFAVNYMMKYFREDLHRQLLSIDFKKQVDGLEMLQMVFSYDFYSL